MYAKVFTQILDSSIAEDWQTRLVFEDFLKLCDPNGVVDMTPEVIARRTNVPLDIVKRGIAELEKPDPRSRNPEHEGRRIILIDPHRDWGWFICNHAYYRSLVSEDQRREKTKVRTQKWREKSKLVTAGDVVVTLRDAPVTHSNASDAMQKQKQRQRHNTCSTKATKFSPSRKLSPTDKELADYVERLLGNEWPNDAGKWLNRIAGGIGTDGKTVAAEPWRVRRVFQDLERAVKDEEVTGTPAEYSEFRWKEFK